MTWSFLRSAVAQAQPSGAGTFGQGGAINSIPQTTTGTTTGGSLFSGNGQAGSNLLNDQGLTANTGIVGDMSLSELVQLVIVYAFILAAALSAVFIFIGGINFILSGGSDDKIRQAVNTIRYSIIGLIVTILSFTFVTIIGRIFGLDFLGYVSYDSIRESINRIVQTTQTSSPDVFAPR